MTATALEAPVPHPTSLARGAVLTPGAGPRLGAVVGGRFGAVPRDLARFAAVGFANTALFLAVYLLFRTLLSATTANVLATALTTITGTSANGRVTFHVAGAIGLRRHAKSMAVTVLGLAITTGAVNLVDADDNALGELAVLIAASAAAGILRFALMRHWVFAGGEPGRPGGDPPKITHGLSLERPDLVTGAFRQCTPHSRN